MKTGMKPALSAVANIDFHAKQSPTPWLVQRYLPLEHNP